MTNNFSRREFLTGLASGTGAALGAESLLRHHFILDNIPSGPEIDDSLNKIGVSKNDFLMLCNTIKLVPVNTILTFPGDGGYLTMTREAGNETELKFYSSNTNPRLLGKPQDPSTKI